MELSHPYGVEFTLLMGFLGEIIPFVEFIYLSGIVPKFELSYPWIFESELSHSYSWSKFRIYFSSFDYPILSVGYPFELNFHENFTFLELVYPLNKVYNWELSNSYIDL